MKKMLFTAAMLMLSSVSFAQFSNSASNSSSNVNTDGWSTFYLQWNPSSFVPDKGDSESFTGFSIGVNKAFSMSQSTPIYLEAGIGVQYSFKTFELSEEYAEQYNVDEEQLSKLMDPKKKFSMISAKVPVSIGYNFQIPNSSVSLMPFAGLDFRFNIIGKMKSEYNLTSEFVSYLKKYENLTQKQIDENFSEESINLFDKDDMGSSEATWNRFQIGWHIGLNAYFNNKYMIGASYGTDFSEISKKTKINTGSISLGICF